MRFKIIFLAIAFLPLAAGSKTLLSDTPKPMLDNVAALSEASAAIKICFQSDQYDLLSAEFALALHALNLRIETLVDDIANHYKDDALYLTYALLVTQVSEDPSLVETMRSKYDYCGEKLLVEMKNNVDENERILQQFLQQHENQ